MKLPFPADLMARAIMEGVEKDYGNYVGVGGGHYAPKLSSYFFSNDINMVFSVFAMVPLSSGSQANSPALSGPSAAGFNDSTGRKAE